MLRCAGCLLQDFDMEDEDEAEQKQGFYLEYVQQAGVPARSSGSDSGGPHILEIALKGAKVCWPYFCQMTFITEIAATYSHYFVRPWVPPNPQARQSLCLCFFPSPRIITCLQLERLNVL